MGRFNDSGYVEDVFVSGSYAYVADWWDGLEIFDISDPTAPVEVGQFNDGGSSYGIYVSESYAYVADGHDGLEIFKISIPNNTQNSLIPGYDPILLLSTMGVISVILGLKRLKNINSSG